MKKKMVLALCALLLMHPVLACAEMISITELRQQVEEMGRWTQTYEAHGRTIEVDVPIIVPAVEMMPVATIEWLKLYEDEQFEVFNRNRGANITRTNDEMVMEYHVDLDEWNDVEKWRSDILRIACNRSILHSFYGKYNDPDALFALHPNKYLVAPYTYYYPWEVDENKAYAEENPVTVQEVNDSLKQLLEKVGLETLSLQMKLVCVAGRGRMVKNLNEAALGETVDYVPMGFYLIRYAQKFGEVPVILHYANMYDFQSFTDLGKMPNVGTRPDAPGCEFSYCMMDSGSYEFNSGLGLGVLKDTVEQDVPLAPLSKVIDSIEERIKSGNIRDVYNLQLGYAVMLNPDEGKPEEFYVYPFWKLECTWLDSAKKEKRSHPDPGYSTSDFRKKLEYREIGINAQTGELVVPRFTKRSEITDDLYDCPKIITWEEAQ